MSTRHGCAIQLFLDLLSSGVPVMLRLGLAAYAAPSSTFLMRAGRAYLAAVKTGRMHSSQDRRDSVATSVGTHFLLRTLLHESSLFLFSFLCVMEQLLIATAFG
jgi:hypothetical protein